MKKTKLLTLSIIVLILLNVATLGFLLLKPEHGRSVMPREIIIHKLHFNAGQQKKYDQLIHWHRGEITRLERQMHDAKNRLYLQLLKNEPDNKEKDSLIHVLASCQSEIEKTHFKHFEDIKSLCDKDQLKDYYALTGELAEMFANGHPPKRLHQ